MAFVDLEQRGSIGILTMNRPEALNALNDQVLRDLDAALDTVEANDEILVARAVPLWLGPTSAR